MFIYALLVHGNNFSSQCEADQISLGVKIEFVHEVGTVSFGNLRSNSQTRRDFSVCQTVSSEVQNVAFGRCQCFVTVEVCYLFSHRGFASRVIVVNIFRQEVANRAFRSS